MKNASVRRVYWLAGLLLTCAIAQAQTSAIPQIVDGGVWQTTIVITNTSATAAIVSLTFFQDAGGGNTSPWSLAFVESVQVQALAVSAGSTVFLHTPGTAATTTIGWGQLMELDGTGAVQAYAIFTQRGSGLQSGTAPAAASVSRILVPFDNSGTATTSMAIANTTAGSVTVNVGIRIAGQADSQPTAITLSAHGHLAFDFPHQFGIGGKSGLAEFYAPSGSFSILALRFQSTAFTAAPVYSVTGPPIIASASSSGGGNTAGNITFAGFSVGLLNQNGGSLPTSGTVTQIAGGQFASYTPDEWNLPFQAQMFGSCGVLDVSYPASGKAPYAADAFLDAGTIAISGAGVAAGSMLMKLNAGSGPVYSFVGPAGSIEPGQAYTLSSTGGPQINAFNTTSAALPSNFAVTNWDSITAINRASGLTINWSGTGFDQVIISMTGTTFGANTHAVTISCAVAASLGTFSVPLEALAKLPAVQSGTATSAGVLSVTVGTTADGQITGVSTTSKSFTPTLVSTGQPIDYGSFTSFLAVAKSLSIL